MWIQKRVVYTRSVRVQVNSDCLRCHCPTGCWWKVLLLAEYSIDIGRGWGVIGGCEKKRKGRSVEVRTETKWLVKGECRLMWWRWWQTNDKSGFQHCSLHFYTSFLQQNNCGDRFNVSLGWFSTLFVLNEYGSETVTLTKKQKVEKEVKEHDM